MYGIEHRMWDYASVRHAIRNNAHSVLVLMALPSARPTPPPRASVAGDKEKDAPEYVEATYKVCRLRDAVVYEGLYLGGSRARIAPC